MTSGLTWNEIGNYDQWFNDETKMDLSFNPVKFILKKDMEAQPGLKWNYSGGNTQLLAEIICRKSGKNIDQFANEYIFAPLGISKNEWVCLTMKNIPAAASGLRLTSRDLLKFGLLYLNSGTINRTQVIDSTWIEKSISPRVQRPDLTSLNISNGDYGYQFWTYHYTLRKKNLKIIEAKGNGGQSIFICKDLNLVVVVTAGNYGEAQYNNIPEKILREFVLPSII